MHFFKAACLVTVFLCLVYIGDCGSSEEGEITPILNEVDNNIAMASNVLDNIAVLEAAVVTDAVQVVTAAWAPFLDAINSVSPTLGNALECATTGIERSAAAIQREVTGYINCIRSGASQIGDLKGQLRGFTTRRNDPSLLNIVSDLLSLVGGILGVGGAIDKILSQVTDLLTDVLSTVLDIVHSAIFMVTCIVKVKLTVTAQGLQILEDFVSCAIGLGVPVTLPSLPPPPVDIATIIQQALEAYGTASTVTDPNTVVYHIAAVASLIAKTVISVKAVADKIAAVTDVVIKDAISGAVQPYVTKLGLLKTLNILNAGVQADVQGCIDKLTAIQNGGIASTMQAYSKLSREASSLQQRVASWDGRLKDLVRTKGVSAIISCASNVCYTGADYVQACTQMVVNNSRLTLQMIRGDLAFISAAANELTWEVGGTLTGQAAIAAGKAADVYNACMQMLMDKYGILV